MDLPDDFADFFRCLNEAKVEYMLIGGYAVMVHGYLRTTQDLDIWVRASAENSKRLFHALDEFGMPPGIQQSDFAKAKGEPPTGFRFGRPPFAIDILSSIQGLGFEEAWSECQQHHLAGIPIRIIGLASLKKNKRATGRLKDAADIEELERLHPED